jgi:hypothetical protein
MPYAAVNGLRLYYEEEGTGPPLVLLLPSWRHWTRTALSEIGRQ